MVSYLSKKIIHKFGKLSKKNILTCSVNLGHFVQLYVENFSFISSRALNFSTSSISLRWRSFKGSSPGRPSGLASVRRSNSWVAMVTDCDGGSDLKNKTTVKPV